jgi:S-formylglutathione hydrolase
VNGLQALSEHRCFGGTQGTYQHASTACAGPMRFALFQPPQARRGKVPVLYFLSGLTCTEENFTVKAGAQRVAAELGLMLVVPDTSPRDTGIPGEADDENFGAGAGFYLDATQAPWSRHFNMYSYVAKELPALVAGHFPADMTRESIFGHSMGGHGALTVALKDPARFRALSALAPISAPMQSRENVFSRYLGPDRNAWREYDACELVRRRQFPGTILIDQGDADPLLAGLQPERFAAACQASGQPLNLRMQAGYGHNYFFVASFVEDHLRHHAAALCT